MRDSNLPRLLSLIETLAKAERSHAGKFQNALDTF